MQIMLHDAIKTAKQNACFIWLPGDSAALLKDLLRWDQQHLVPTN